MNKNLSAGILAENFDFLMMLFVQKQQKKGNIVYIVWKIDDLFEKISIFYILYKKSA